ncbi:MAG: transposase [Nitrososphaerota archaeon]
MPSKARRGWAVYNEALVRRAEILFSFDVLDRWDEELESMNDGKVGAPYRYPDSFIGCLVDIKHLLKVGYRQVEGILRALSKRVKRLNMGEGFKA